ncbi:glutamyl-tRNA(Gln) amidotransferase subunit A [Striga asiatica]|uniref:Glutamyl-tRNA(Gln) amidotransferase subunit A n=1 Tax=Striga asiatica TaxID=4170 RepID=A0A5A7QY12_STRAF|nr:glutamyl-tRNA(Gln) amidotransferase subunit A [Striga asiatica]
MAATVSAWAKPGAWALDAEENETELLSQHREDAAAAINGRSNTGGAADFPSLSAAAAVTKTKKKKKPQTVSLQEFVKPEATQPKGLTQDELLALPTGPRQRTAEELDRNKLGGGFRSYGVGIRDEQPRRQGGFNREADREFAPSRADETDNWATGKKSSPAGFGDRRDRGERGGFFTDSQSRADGVDNWASKKSFVPSEPRRLEKRGGFGLESGNSGSESDNWLKRKEDERPRPGSSFDSLRERRGVSDADSESWGRKRDESSVGGGRPKLNLQPRTLPVGEGQKEEVAGMVKPKSSNPFGEARPREEVLKEKGQDWKEIEEKLESMKVKEVASVGPKRSFWNGNGRERPRVEEQNAWRKSEADGSRPQRLFGFSSVLVELVLDLVTELNIARKRKAMARGKSPPSLLSVLSLLLLLLSGLLLEINGHDFSIEEATVDEIRRAFAEKKLTSRRLVEYYLDRIKTLNPALRGVIEVNPDALDQAEAADREREAGNGGLPPLHGVPVLLKDSIATRDEMNTTAGSFALLGSVPPRDAGVVERLRRAGAVILGKASMSEWYHFRSPRIPDGWCARAGQGVNPYVKDGNPCGSSSGSAISVAANMAMVSLGTETDGSLICPADHNSVVAIKPTVGLTSRAGVIPLSPRQDTVGPICRTVSDAVYVLDSIVGFDSRDSEATKAAAKFIPVDGYTQFLNKDGLKGRRLGVELCQELGQDILIAANSTNGIENEQRQAVETMERLSRDGFEKLMIENELDAMVTLNWDASTLLAIGGFPGITVPAGYDSNGMPFGICFGGLKGSEPLLIEIGYAFEQATRVRKPPSLKLADFLHASI